MPIRINAPNVFLAARERFAAEAAPLVTLEFVAETLGFDPTTLTKWKSRGYLDYDAPRTGRGHQAIPCVRTADVRRFIAVTLGDPLPTPPSQTPPSHEKARPGRTTPRTGRIKDSKKVTNADETQIG